MRVCGPGAWRQKIKQRPAGEPLKRSAERESRHEGSFDGALYAAVQAGEIERLAPVSPASFRANLDYRSAS